MLSLGKFKPTQYAFFDGDVIYDSRYASGSEKQSEIEKRIKEVPRLKAQYVYSGIETQITKINKLVKEGEIYGDTDPAPGIQLGSLGKPDLMLMDDVVFQSTAEKNYSLTLPLGESSISSDYYPAWDIKFLHSSASVNADGTSFINELTGTTFKSLRIPQGEVEIRYKTYVTYVDEFGEVIVDYLEDPSVMTEDDPFGFLFPDVYGNDSTIQVKSDYLLLDILEENVDFETKNFDIEVFTVDGAGNEQQLFFLKDDEEKTVNHVEWWFNIYVDEEISPQIFCRSQKQHKSKNIFADQRELFKCPDIEEEIPFENIYEVTISDKDFEEPC